MAKNPERKRPESDDVRPDAWERFERAVDVVAKSKPKPKRKADGKPTGNKALSPAKPAKKRQNKKGAE